MTDKGAGETGGEAAKAAGGAKGPEELRRQIEQTRGELGNTVAELAGKADVKGRAQARAADLKDKAGAMTVQLRSSAVQAGHALQDRATRAGHVVQDRASHAGHVVQDRATHAGHVVQDRASQAGHAVQDRAAHAGHTVHDRATHAGHTVEHGLPRPVRTAVQAGLRHPRPVLIVGAAVGAVVATEVLRRRRHGHH